MPFGVCRHEVFEVHWIADVVGGLALLVLGFILGGTAAFYKGWDEGFREGYRQDIEENVTRLPKGRSGRSSGASDFAARKAS